MRELDETAEHNPSLLETSTASQSQQPGMKSMLPRQLNDANDIGTRLSRHTDAATSCEEILMTVHSNKGSVPNRILSSVELSTVLCRTCETATTYCVCSRLVTAVGNAAWKSHCHDVVPYLTWYKLLLTENKRKWLILLGRPSVETINCQLAVLPYFSKHILQQCSFLIMKYNYK